jgi:hemerythrin-like domain-containing protein
LRDISDSSPFNGILFNSSLHYIVKSLEQQIAQLTSENQMLRTIVQQNLNDDIKKLILNRGSESLCDILESKSSGH